MKFKETMGIDVSKKTIDVFLHLNGSSSGFDNAVKGYKALLLWLKKQTRLNTGQVLICFEHTGLYSLPLAVFLNQQRIFFSMVPALEIKRSLGIVRGKNDQIDAFQNFVLVYLCHYFFSLIILFRNKKTQYINQENRFLELLFFVHKTYVFSLPTKKSLG
ncbi:MAG: hypothetical protein ACI9XJ_002742 [Marivirga sp.]|jgi:hypothetical protein